MTRKIKMMTATYKNIKLPATNTGKLRGFYADLDMADNNLHNHTEEGKDIYRYPRVQYKILKEHPVIVAVEEGIRSLHPHLMEQTELRIGDKVYSDMTLDISLSEQMLGDSREIRGYRFVTPWLALNQKNYQEYQDTDSDGKEQILSRILIGNILSLCKGFGVTIEGKLSVEYQLKSRYVIYKGTKMEAFTGKFQVNCRIPELLGIGKGTASGFGVVGIDSKYGRERR